MNEKEAANEREKSESDHIWGAFFARMTMLRVPSRYAKKELMTEQSGAHDERSIGVYVAVSSKSFLMSTTSWVLAFMK